MRYLNLFKKFLIVISIVFCLAIVFKLTIFYLPFLVAYIISIIIDPIIKFINKKTSLSRKTCSIIVLVLLFAIIMGIIVLGGIKLTEEATNLVGGLNNYLEKTIIFFDDIISKINFNNLSISDEVVEIFQNTFLEYLNMVTSYLKGILNKLIEYITAIPGLFISIIITILATYFISSDKFYILDRLEHHFSKKMMGKVIINLKTITSLLGSYIKAELLLSFITFIIVLSGLNIYYLVGMDIEYPILMALLIGFVDVLPILGAGTIMLPWAIILIVNGDYSGSFSILGLYIFTVVTKQIIEPKLVSKSVSIHPIFTLISMYTGFKILGLIGLIVGPIILIILKSIFKETLDKGILNSISDI